MAEVPAGPLLQALEQRRSAFTGLKSFARIKVVKRGRKRVLESVGIVLDAQRRFRIEAYGPLGQSRLVVVWNGREVLARLPGNDGVVRQGPLGLERLLGAGLEVQELCALLSGNIPADVPLSDARLFCGRNSMCTLVLTQGDVVRRLGIFVPPGPEYLPRFVSQELSVSGDLVYRAKFDRTAVIASYPLPMSIVIENPDKKLSLTIAYSDAEVNIPISDESFLLNDPEADLENSRQ
jgi:outer membrane lipoprotein-sorting protein